MDIVIESFKNFVNDRFARYRMGRQFYPSKPSTEDQFSLNPYLITEADIQVKFGGYLEDRLLQHHPQLTVHAEMPVYKNLRARADLTIHRAGTGSYWVSHDLILASLDSVIEIKYANVITPYHDFNSGGIKKDIKVLGTVPDSVKKYLIIVDEAELIEPGKIKNFLDDAKASHITIVSNNHKIISEV